MALSRLTNVNQSLKPQETKEEAGVRANTAEAMRLYQRGVAAARGGQKRIAAGLLTRSVQHDPNNEGAWLWLSGVIEDPHQIAFCLHAVLKLNPANERAHRGLRWLEERQLLKGDPNPAPLFDVQVGAPAVTSPVVQQSDSWWVHWRQWKNDKRAATLVLWSIPLVVLFLALLINQAFLTVTQQTTRPDLSTLSPNLPDPSAIAAESVQHPVAVLPADVPILNNESMPILESKTLVYLNNLQPIREQLRSAVQQYRQSTGKPGSAAVGHAASAQHLRSTIEQAHEIVQKLSPPPDLQEAHASYLKGLELELEAIDSLSAFYSSYKTELANLAAVRFQEANSYFSFARTRFDEQLQHIQQTCSISSHTPR